MNLNRRLIDAEVLKSKIATCITVESRGKNIYENLVGFVLETVRDVIDAQPTVDAEPHWIPCSERMPNDDKDYLVTDGESMAVGYYRTDAKAWDNVNFGWLEHREETCGLKMVIAWMPLPEPYEGDKE